ncbi:hypothetical protein EBZ39_00195 [bacterium]|nr:hypothetical protein [bacterium]
MSTPDFVYTPHGRQGIGVIQPQSGLDYPFVNPSEDIRYLVADFYLSYDDQGEYVPSVPKTKFPLRIKYLLNIGDEPSDLPTGAPVPINEVDIVLVDANGTEIFNTVSPLTTCSVEDWGTDYKIITWYTTHAVCRIVVYKTWKTGEPEPKYYPQHLAPKNAVLDARTVDKMPKRLLSLRVRQRNGTVVNGPYTGNIRFTNNYNTEITAAATTTSNFLVNTNVSFLGVAGTGAGYFPVCGSGYDEATQEIIPQPIKQINGITATKAGDFLLSAGDCLYMRRPTSTIGGKFGPHPTAQQQVGADCTPCCACNDYLNTALYMNELGRRYALIGRRTTDVNSIHAANIQAWNQKRACTVENPLKLLLVPQCCPLLDVVMMLCNPCQVCYQPSTLSLAMTSAVPIELVCGNTTLYQPDGSTAAPGLNITPITGGIKIDVPLPAIKAGGSSYVKFRVKATDNKAYPIVGTLTGTFADGSPIQTGCPEETREDNRQAAQTVKSATLACDQFGNDARACAIT